MLSKFKSVAAGVKSRIAIDAIVYESLADACRLLNKDYNKTKRRLHRGWTIEEAFDFTERRNTSLQKKHQQEAREIAQSGYKVCATCNEKKSIEKFPIHKTCIGGVSRVCRSCKTSASREKRYGVTKQQYTDMYIKQGGKCAICGTINPGSRVAKDGSKSFCVDHCHTTGVIRGLLCFKCNSGLGNFKDNQERLARAIDYLEGKKSKRSK